MSALPAVAELPSLVEFARTHNLGRTIIAGQARAGHPNALGDHHATGVRHQLAGEDEQ